MAGMGSVAVGPLSSGPRPRPRRECPLLRAGAHLAGAGDPRSLPAPALSISPAQFGAQGAPQPGESGVGSLDAGGGHPGAPGRTAGTSPLATLEKQRGVRQPLRWVPEATAGHPGRSRAPRVSEKQRPLDGLGSRASQGSGAPSSVTTRGLPASDPRAAVAPRPAEPCAPESRVQRPLPAAWAPRRAWASPRLRARRRDPRVPARWTGLEPSSDIVLARGCGAEGTGSVGALGTHRSRGKGRERPGPQEAQVGESRGGTARPYGAGRKTDPGAGTQTSSSEWAGEEAGHLRSPGARTPPAFKGRRAARGRWPSGGGAQEPGGGRT